MAQLYTYPLLVTKLIFCHRLPRGNEGATVITDLNTKNLPEQVCDEFRKLVDEQWQAAVTELENSGGDVTRDDRYRFLCAVLMVSEVTHISKPLYNRIVRSILLLPFYHRTIVTIVTAINLMHY